MLLKQETLKGIETGAITLAFRRWRRPTVKAGGTLLTPIGQVAIEALDRVSLQEITESQAAAAGHSDLAALLAHLSRRTEGDVYRVRLALAGPDPRVALRESIPDRIESEQIIERLKRLDSRSVAGPWTHRLLQLLYQRPEKRAADLARDIGMDRAKFKANVRKLKGLGLTESLKIGYRLSPRGKAVLRRLEG